MEPEFPEHFERIILRCLEKDPARRYSNTADLLADLQSAQIASSNKTPVQSVAVLPFTDMSREKDQDYFCEGMAEELINVLAHLPALKVASRVSSFQFKNLNMDVREIGKKLGVSTVLEGSVRKSGDRLRITAQLINVADGYHIWSERYNRELVDVFDIQDEIAQAIANALSVPMQPEQKMVLKKQKANIQAYDYYLRGLHFFDRGGFQDFHFAKEMFDRAISIDPNYAPAYAGLANTLCFEYFYMEHSEAKLKRAEEASSKALEIAPNSIEAMVAAGFASTLRGKYKDAEEFFERALQINPNDHSANYLYGRALWSQGKFEQAISRFQKAMVIMPEDFTSASLIISVYRAIGKEEEITPAAKNAFEVCDRWLALNPDDLRARYLGAGALATLGNVERSKQWLDLVMNASPNDPPVLYNVACVYAMLGEDDRCLDALERAVEAGFSHRSWIENDGDLYRIHNHSRYRALLKKLPDPTA